MNKKLAFHLIVWGTVSAAGALMPAIAALGQESPPDAQFNYSISITSADVDQSERIAALDGIAGGNPYVGSLKAVHVGVTDWGDGQSTVPVTDFVITSTTASPKTFSATWSATHTYAGPGEYIVTAAVYHGEVSPDNEQIAIATTTVTVHPRIVATAGDGGTIAPSGTIMTDYHGTQTFTIHPGGGRTIGAILIDGVSTSTADSYTFADVTADHTIDVRFISGPTKTLTVTSTGTGTGMVTSDPAGISCGSAGSVCAADFSKDATVTLTAAPDAPTSTFEGWGGACADAGTSTTCTLTLSDDVSASAAFGIQEYQLSVAPGGTGNGVIADASGTLMCDSADATSSICAHLFPIGTSVTLTAAPDASSTFALWSTGPCTGATSPSCSFVIDAVTTQSTIVAIFSGTLIVPVADLSVEKTSAATSTFPGGGVQYHISAANLGPDAAGDVSVSDSLPDGLTLANATASQGAYESSTGVWTIGALPAGSAATLDLSATVDPLIDASSLTNAASIGDIWSEDPDPANNSSSVTIAVLSGSAPTSGPDLALRKTVNNGTPEAGATVQYSIVVTNDGDAPATFVTAADTWPSGLTYASATSSQGSIALLGSGINWDVGTIEPHATATMAIAMVVGQGEAGNTIRNVAAVSSTLSSFIDPTPENNSSSATIAVQSGSSNGGGTPNGNTGGGMTVGVGAGGPLAPRGQGMVLGVSTTNSVATSSLTPTLIVTPPSGQVLGASTTCGYYLTGYITPERYAHGSNDPVEVMKLQVFLNKELGLRIPITGYYGPLSEAAVRQLQVNYATDVLAPWIPHGLVSSIVPTGYVYKTTQRLINMIMCPSLNLPIPQLP